MQGDRVRSDLNWHTVLSNFSYFGTVTKLLLLVKIWVDGILTMIIEVYVLRDHNGSVCDFYFHLFPLKK